MSSSILVFVLLVETWPTWMWGLSQLQHPILDRPVSGTELLMLRRRILWSWKSAYANFCSLQFFGGFFCKIDDAGCIVLQTALSASECDCCSEWERLSIAFPASWKWPHDNRGGGRGVMWLCGYCHANEVRRMCIFWFAHTQRGGQMLICCWRALQRD